MSFNNLSIQKNLKKIMYRNSGICLEASRTRSHWSRNCHTDAECLQFRKPQGHKAETFSSLVISSLLTLDNASKTVHKFYPFTLQVT